MEDLEDLTEITINNTGEQRSDQLRKKLLHRDSFGKQAIKYIAGTLMIGITSVGIFYSACNGPIHSPSKNSSTNTTREAPEHEEKTLIKTTETRKSNTHDNIAETLALATTPEERLIYSGIEAFYRKDTTEATAYTAGALIGYLTQRKTDILTSAVSQTAKTLVKACNANKPNQQESFFNKNSQSPSNL